LTEKCRLLVKELRKGKQPEDVLFTRENGEPIRDMRDVGCAGEGGGVAGPTPARF